MNTSPPTLSPTAGSPTTGSPTTGAPRPLPPALPIGEVLAASAARWPARPAIVVGESRMSFADLDRAANRFANALLAAGFGKGRTIAILAHSRREYPVFHFGAARANALQAHLSLRYTADDLVHVIGKAGIEAVFADAGGLATLRAARPRLPGLRTVVVLGDEPPGPGETSWDAFLAGAGDAAPTLAIDPDDPFCITFTGGTTGFPKGVLATHAARSIPAQGLIEPFEIRPGDVAIICTPIFHLAGLGSWLTPALAGGATAVLMPRWDPALFATLAAREQATMAMMVPTMINAILNDPGFDAAKLATLRLFNYGGAPMPVALLHRMFEKLPQIRMLDHYGQSEGGALTCRPHDDARDKPASAGLPFDWVELAILDGEGAPVAQGGIGEICVKGPQTCAGYVNEPEQTAALRLPGGWLKTGDIGYRDAAGHVFLVDRSKDMIIGGGENIYPAEIENALFQHPAVRECAVFGIPDEHWGEVPAAHVVLNDSAASAGATPEALAEFVATRIARHKRPRLVKLVDALPKTAIGKIQKNLIRAPYWAGKGRNI